MTPFVLSLLAGLARYSLASLAGWLINRGMLPGGDYSQQIAELAIGIATAVGTLGWMAWSQFVAHRESVVQRALAGVSTEMVKALVKDPSIINPSVMVETDVVPVLRPAHV